MLNRAMDKEGITDAATRERILKVAYNESRFDPNARGPILPSGMHKGDQAHGLLQVMPKTAEGIGFSREQIRNPETAALAGVRVFKMNMATFNGNLDAATVAHHAGPGGARKWLASGSAGTTDLATGLKTDDYLRQVAGTSSVSTMAALVPPTPSSSGTNLASSSNEVSSARMQVASAPPIIVNSPTTNNMQQGGSQRAAQYTAPSVVDSEFMKMLVYRVI